MKSSLRDYIEKNPEVDFSEREDCIIKLRKDGSYIHLHQHAFYAFMKRVKECQSVDIQNFNGLKYLKTLCRLFTKGEEVERSNRVRQIIKHNFKPADYIYNSGWIFVIEKDTLITTYYKGKLNRNLYRIKNYKN